MRRTAFIISTGLAAALATSVFAANGDAPIPPPISCGSGIPGGVNCIVSKKDLKQARNAFDKGVKLQDQRNLEEAFNRFDEATRLAPQNMQFLTAREMVKAQLVFQHVQRGNALMLENVRAQAAAEFRAALELDADNEFARLELCPSGWRIREKSTLSQGMTWRHSITPETCADCLHNYLQHIR